MAVTVTSGPKWLVISFNIRGIQLGGDPFKSRITPLYDYIKSHPVREVHLQEVFTYGMLRELARHMPLRHAVYEKGLVGPKGGLVSFYDERPKRVKFYRLSPSSLARLDFPSTVPYIHKGLLITYLGNGGVRCNLHLEPNHSGDWEHSNGQTSLNTQQLDQVADVVQDIIRVGDISDLLVMGDFNLPHTAQSYANFIAKTQLRDAFEGNWAPTFHAAFLPKNRKPHHIDQILSWSGSASEFEISRAEYIFTQPIHGMYVSDHIGLAIKVRHT